MWKLLIILTVTVIIAKGVESKGRSKKSKSLKAQYHPHQHEIYESQWLPSDVQITTYLYQDLPKTFFYWSYVEEESLSALVMTCSSTVNWSMLYHSSNNNTIGHIPLLNYTESTKDIDIRHYKSSIGLYLLQVLSKERSTFVHIYISTENGGPQALKSAMQNSLKILKKGKKNWVTLRWEPSLVDPQRTDYCLVINTEKHYETMCSAEHDQRNQPIWEIKFEIARSFDYPSPSIQCVGRKNHVKVKVRTDLLYYFDLFAINKQSNLTYLLDRKSQKFDFKTRFMSIRDGKFMSINKIEGKSVFRFKVRRKSGSTLNFYIIPCGSFVYVDIKLKRKIIVPQIRVNRFKNITIPNVIKGQRYIVRVLPAQEELINTGVEIYATTRSSIKSPLPAMPQNTTVKEYETLRTCNSFTLGWMPVLDQSSATYCFIVKEGKIKENGDYSQPNQCGLENRLKKSLDYTLRFCRNIDHKNQDVITKEIKRLKPGKSYIVLVSVSNPKGRSLSYNLVQVNTLNYCNSYKSSE